MKSRKSISPKTGNVPVLLQAGERCEQGVDFHLDNRGCPYRLVRICDMDRFGAR